MKKIPYQKIEYLEKQYKLSKGEKRIFPKISIR